MNLKSIISAYGKYILIGLIIFLVFIAINRGCRLNNLRDSYNQLKGQYDALKVRADSEIKKALEYIKTQDARIAEQNKIITLKDKDIADKYRTIQQINSSLATLEAEYATIPDKDAAIRNLLLQVGAYKQKCLSFESIIENKDAQISAWEAKFIAQSGISDTWKKRYEDEHALRLVADQALAVQEKRLKSFSFGSKIKTIAIIAVSGYLAYDLMGGRGK